MNDKITINDILKAKRIIVENPCHKQYKIFYVSDYELEIYKKMFGDSVEYIKSVELK